MRRPFSRGRVRGMAPWGFLHSRRRRLFDGALTVAIVVGFLALVAAFVRLLVVLGP